mmetsp:Transcript_25807/g.103084  ORF Transcript_25807/g.103084 Transcript_25807/m.103084 type:complete len:403 (-) Transcript_25807:1600-2808(-)
MILLPRSWSGRGSTASGRPHGEGPVSATARRERRDDAFARGRRVEVARRHLRDDVEDRPRAADLAVRRAAQVALEVGVVVEAEGGVGHDVELAPRRRDERPRPDGAEDDALLAEKGARVEPPEAPRRLERGRPCGGPCGGVVVRDARALGGVFLVATRRREHAAPVTRGPGGELGDEVHDAERAAQPAAHGARRPAGIVVVVGVVVVGRGTVDAVGALWLLLAHHHLAERRDARAADDEVDGAHDGPRVHDGLGRRGDVRAHGDDGVGDELGRFVVEEGDRAEVLALVDVEREGAEQRLVEVVHEPRDIGERVLVDPRLVDLEVPSQVRRDGRRQLVADAVLVEEGLELLLDALLRRLRIRRAAMMTPVVVVRKQHVGGGDGDAAGGGGGGVLGGGDGAAPA